MKEPETKPTVRLIGQDGNAFSIMGRVKQALRRAGRDFTPMVLWEYTGFFNFSTF